MNTEAIHILVVEDSPTQATKLQWVLEERGYRVSVAHDGREALASLAREKPAVVVSDIIMPEMDGYALCRHIKGDAALSAVPVILLTALSDPRDILRALACGADNFVTKPYKDDVLFDRLDRVLATRGADREAETGEGQTISFQGETHVLPQNIRQVTTLLLSTYEEAADRRVDLERVNGELQQAQQELQTLNETLEGKVRERTAQLEMSEAELRHAQAEEIRLRDRFLSHASHELRTPVTAAYQFVTILLDGLAGELAPEQREYLQIVSRNVEELTCMIDDLMDVTRGDAEGWDIHPEVLDIVPAMRQAQQRMENPAKAKGIQITMAGPDALPGVLADPKRVRQVAMNLMAHAVRHTPEGGCVRMAWGLDDEDPACVRVAITDEAEPLSDHDRRHLFDKMYQVGDAIDDGRKGLGLELHIANELVGRQGGRMRVERGGPRGNTISFTLPMKDGVHPVTLTPNNT